MTKRRMLAATTLAALPTFTAVSQSVAPLAPALEAGALQVASTPQWGWAWGMEGGEALAFGLIGAIQCSLFGPW